MQIYRCRCRCGHIYVCVCVCVHVFVCVHVCPCVFMCVTFYCSMCPPRPWCSNVWTAIHTHSSEEAFGGSGRWISWHTVQTRARLVMRQSQVSACTCKATVAQAIKWLHIFAKVIWARKFTSWLLYFMQHLFLPAGVFPTPARTFATLFSNVHRHLVHGWASSWMWASINCVICVLEKSARKFTSWTLHFWKQRSQLVNLRADFWKHQKHALECMKKISEKTARKFTSWPCSNYQVLISPVIAYVFAVHALGTFTRNAIRLHIKFHVLFSWVSRLWSCSSACTSSRKILIARSYAHGLHQFSECWWCASGYHEVEINFTIWSLTRCMISLGSCFDKSVMCSTEVIILMIYEY